MTADGTRALAVAVLRRALPAGQVPAALDFAPGEGATLGSSGTPSLRVIEGPQHGDLFTLSHEETMGRAREASLRLIDPGASRLHARFRLAAGSLQVEDLGSKNGLFVNGRRLRRRARRLRPGDRIAVGSTRLEVVWRPSGPPETPGPGRARALAGALLVAAAAALALGW